MTPYLINNPKRQGFLHLNSCHSSSRYPYPLAKIQRSRLFYAFCEASISSMSMPIHIEA